MILVRLKLFGRFRSFSKESEISLQVESGLNVLSLKKKIEAELQRLCPQAADQALVFDSVLASKNEILSDEMFLTESCQLAILPPVCGG